MSSGDFPERADEAPTVESGAEPTTEVHESVIDPQAVEPTPPEIASPPPVEEAPQPNPVQEKADAVQDATHEKAEALQDTVQEKAEALQDTVQEKAAAVQDTVSEKTTAVSEQTDEKPEILVGAAFAGGLALALVLKKLGS